MTNELLPLRLTQFADVQLVFSIIFFNIFSVINLCQNENLLHNNKNSTFSSFSCVFLWSKIRCYNVKVKNKILAMLEN